MDKRTSLCETCGCIVVARSARGSIRRFCDACFGDAQRLSRKILYASSRGLSARAAEADAYFRCCVCGDWLPRQSGRGARQKCCAGCRPEYSRKRAKEWADEHPEQVRQTTRRNNHRRRSMPGYREAENAAKRYGAGDLWRPCVSCGEAFERRRRTAQKYCSAKCRHEGEAKQRQDRRGLSAKEAEDAAYHRCEICGVYVPRSSKLGAISRYCSACYPDHFARCTSRQAKEWALCHPERKRQIHREWARRNPEKAQAPSRRWRARKYGAVSEPYTRVEIFDRDGWLCQLCGERVSTAYAEYPHPLYATIDHIIPLSREGSDTRANVQTACFRCNARKHNKLPSELELAG